MASERGLLAQMVISPRGTVAVVSYDRKFLRVLHSTKLTLMTQPRFDEQWPLAISPDGRMMTTEGANARVWGFNGDELRVETGRRRSTFMVFAPTIQRPNHRKQLMRVQR